MSGSAARWLRVGAPLGLAALVALGAAAATSLVGEAGVEPSERAGASSGDQAPEGSRDAGPEVAPDAAYRYDDRGRLTQAPADEDFVCRRPELAIPESEGCAAGRGYPHCRWQLPDAEAAGSLYEVWRNTVPEHRWARPGLVSLIIAASAEYARRWPGEHVTVGDLDAPGPRHQTHDRGVDVDLYLTEAMIARNEGRGRYPDNYEHRSRSEVRALRARVLDLAKILAVCADGDVRIYYNDPDLIHPFRAWYEARGLSSSVGPAMRMHNPLHRFHFHLTVADELAPLPAGR